MKKQDRGPAVLAASRERIRELKHLAEVSGPRWREEREALERRVAGLENALRKMCEFHIAVSGALDDGPGDGECTLSDAIIRLGADADAALEGLDPLPPATAGSASASEPPAEEKT